VNEVVDSGGGREVTEVSGDAEVSGEQDAGAESVTETGVGSRASGAVNLDDTDEMRML
jgi:hypothetical protein